jgi:hypothetical protein
LGPQLGGCPVLPSNHIFNTPIDALHVHPNSAGFMTTIPTKNLHLDLGTTTDTKSEEYYGIPYNLVKGNQIPWVPVSFSSTDPDMGDAYRDEADCVTAASGAAHTLVSPCTAAAAPAPVFPIPASPLVEGGLDSTAGQPYGDHHLLLLDTDNCHLWELYHVYPNSKGNYDVFGSAFFNLKSNALRPADWTSSDAAGFPILPLLLRADEASTGQIKHALRFTITSSLIRAEYTWPARHLTGSTKGANNPPMGQLFRLKASTTIPANFNTQSKAILQAMKTYGMYIADGGSNWYVQGDPSAAWLETTFSQVQSISSSNFEAVDLSSIRSRAGFDPNSSAVP